MILSMHAERTFSRSVRPVDRVPSPQTAGRWIHYLTCRLTPRTVEREIGNQRSANLAADVPPHGQTRLGPLPLE
jgi:hypothetical protein